jgi:hypothetical protein
MRDNDVNSENMAKSICNDKQQEIVKVIELVIFSRDRKAVSTTGIKIYYVCSKNS